jgi:hypothetical protein
VFWSVRSYFLGRSGPHRRDLPTAALSPVETALKELIGGWTENFKGTGRATVHVYLTSCLTSHMVRWSRDKK